MIPQPTAVCDRCFTVSHLGFSGKLFDHKLENACPAYCCRIKFKSVRMIFPAKDFQCFQFGFFVVDKFDMSIFVTVTGCKDVIVKKHFDVMKDNAILCNAGHFDCEVDVACLRKMSVKQEERRNNIIGYTLPDGKTLNVLGEGRLVNLACGMGHPAEIMDMSFAVQALSLKWLAEHRKELTKKVYNVPDSIDDEIGRYKLAAMDLKIDELTEEQKKYLSGWA